MWALKLKPLFDQNNNTQEDIKWHDALLQLNPRRRALLASVGHEIIVNIRRVALKPWVKNMKHDFCFNGEKKLVIPVGEKNKMLF